MTRVTSISEHFPIHSVGPAAQAMIPEEVHSLPATIPASGSVTSNLIRNGGFPLLAAGVTSSQNGQLQVQRYLDDDGQVPQGAAVTASLTGGVAGVCNVTDGLPYSSFSVTITNPGGSPATLTNLAILQQAK